MIESSMSFLNLDELKSFVRTKLGECENLLADQFPFTETKLIRDGRECGRQYVLHGPRSVRLNAIWVSEKNELFFYDARGERFEKLRLTSMPAE